MNSKIQNLLDRAAEITQSETDRMSSVAVAEREFRNAAEAKTRFAGFAEKLFFIRRWNYASGLSSFELYDESGSRREREPARIGDFIKITLAGTGKSDWVKIIDVFQTADQIVLTVQPTYNPTENAPDKSVTSHFFTAESTNNFCLRRKKQFINFYVIGLDEKSNTGDTGGIVETWRNAATANIGHYLGIQKGEWTLFCRNFLEIEAG